MGDMVDLKMLRNVLDMYNIFISSLGIRNTMVRPTSMIFFNQYLAITKMSDKNIGTTAIACIHLATKVCGTPTPIKEFAHIVFDELFTADNNYLVKCLPGIPTKTQHKRVYIQDIIPLIIKQEMAVIRAFKFNFKVDLPYNYYKRYIDVIISWHLDESSEYYQPLKDEISFFSYQTLNYLQQTFTFYMYYPDVVAMAAVKVALDRLNLPLISLPNVPWFKVLNFRCRTAYFDDVIRDAFSGVEKILREKNISYNIKSCVSNNVSAVTGFVRYPYLFNNGCPLCPPPPVELLAEYTKGHSFKGMDVDHIPNEPVPYKRYAKEKKMLEKGGKKVPHYDPAKWVDLPSHAPTPELIRLMKEQQILKDLRSPGRPRPGTPQRPPPKPFPKGKEMPPRFKSGEMKPRPYEMKSKPYDMKSKPYETKSKPYETKSKPDEIKSKPDGMKSKPEEIKSKPDDMRLKPSEEQPKLNDMNLTLDEMRLTPDEMRLKPNEKQERPRPEETKAKPNEKKHREDMSSYSSESSSSSSDISSDSATTSPHPKASSSSSEISSSSSDMSPLSGQMSPHSAKMSVHSAKMGIHSAKLGIHSAKLGISSTENQKEKEKEKTTTNTDDMEPKLIEMSPPIVEVGLQPIEMSPGLDEMQIKPIELSPGLDEIPQISIFDEKIPKANEVDEILSTPVEVNMQPEKAKPQPKKKPPPVAMNIEPSKNQLTAEMVMQMKKNQQPVEMKKQPSKSQLPLEMMMPVKINQLSLGLMNQINNNQQPVEAKVPSKGKKPQPTKKKQPNKNQQPIEMPIPPNDMKKQSNDIKIPSNDIRMPSNDIRIPSNDIRMPSNDIRMPSNDVRLQLNDTRLQSNDMRLQPKDMSIEPNDMRLQSNGMRLQPNNMRLQPNDNLQTVIPLHTEMNSSLGEMRSPHGEWRPLSDRRRTYHSEMMPRPDGIISHLDEMSTYPVDRMSYLDDRRPHSEKRRHHHMERNPYQDDSQQQLNEMKQQINEMRKLLTGVVQQPFDERRPQSGVINPYHDEFGSYPQEPRLNERRSYMDESQQQLNEMRQQIKEMREMLTGIVQQPNRMRPMHHEDRLYHSERRQYEDDRMLYPKESMSYHNERMLYPNERMRYPNERMPYPNERMPYSNERMPYSGVYPNERMSYANERMMYPSERMPYSNERMGYPNERSLYPNDRMSFHNEKSMRRHEIMESSDSEVSSYSDSQVNYSDEDQISAHSQLTGRRLPYQSSIQSQPIDGWTEPVKSKRSTKKKEEPMQQFVGGHPQSADRNSRHLLDRTFSTNINGFGILNETRPQIAIERSHSAEKKRSSKIKETNIMPLEESQPPATKKRATRAKKAEVVDPELLQRQQALQRLMQQQNLMNQLMQLEHPAESKQEQQQKQQPQSQSQSQAAGIRPLPSDKKRSKIREPVLEGEVQVHPVPPPSPTVEKKRSPITKKAEAPERPPVPAQTKRSPKIREPRLFDDESMNLLDGLSQPTKKRQTKEKNLSQPASKPTRREPVRRGKNAKDVQSGSPVALNHIGQLPLIQDKIINDSLMMDRTLINDDISSSQMDWISMDNPGPNLGGPSNFDLDDKGFFDDDLDRNR